jgi:hypothetical protein
LPENQAGGYNRYDAVLNWRGYNEISMHREEEEEIEMDSDDSGKTDTLKLNLIC